MVPPIYMATIVWKSGSTENIHIRSWAWKQNLILLFSDNQDEIVINPAYVQKIVLPDLKKRQEEERFRLGYDSIYIHRS